MEKIEKGGQVFIAYIGTEFKKGDIECALNKICPMYYDVNSIVEDDLIFAKILKYEYAEDKEPYWNSHDGILSVNGYNQDEIERAVTNFSNYDIHIYDKCHRITNFMYNHYNTKMFKMLSDYMHFCSVIYDQNNDSIIAGVTEPNNEYTHLYYGYTIKNRELMFSNDENVLGEFCDEIIEMPENTYMENGILCTLDGLILSFNCVAKNSCENAPLINETKEKANSLIDGFDAFLTQVTDELLREKIEDYLSSSDSKKRVNDLILRELNNEIKKQMLIMVKNYIQEYNLEDSINNKLEEKFDQKLEEYSSKIQVPVVHIIKINDTILGQTKGGFYHEKFEQILSQVQLDEPIMLIGPAGSGKNVAVSQVADALGQHMYYTNNASNEFKLTGFIDAGGNYRDTEFYRAFKNGGIFFLDEIDNSDSSALIVINSALANGYMAFPHETIDRHPNFRIIAAANTWGKGADLQYVGRNALDGATLDRFDNIFFDYDVNLERALYPNDEVLEFMWSFRNAVYQSKIPHIVSTRGIGKVYKKELNGIPVLDTLTSNVVKNLGQDDVNTIIGNMQNISLSNKYYDGIKRLRLSR